MLDAVADVRKTFVVLAQTAPVIAFWKIVDIENRPRKLGPWIGFPQCPGTSRETPNLTAAEVTGRTRYRPSVADRTGSEGAIEGARRRYTGSTDVALSRKPP